MVYFYAYYADGLERMGNGKGGEGWRGVRLRMQLGFLGAGIVGDLGLVGV